MASYDLRTGYELLSSQPNDDREGEDTDDPELAPLAANVIHMAPGSTRRKALFLANSFVFYMSKRNN
jgi:hypothetical protein